MNDVVLSLLLTLNRFHKWFWCFHCWLWTINKSWATSREDLHHSAIPTSLKYWLNEENIFIINVYFQDRSLTTPDFGKHSKHMRSEKFSKLPGKHPYQRPCYIHDSSICVKHLLWNFCENNLRLLELSIFAIKLHHRCFTGFLTL